MSDPVWPPAPSEDDPAASAQPERPQVFAPPPPPATPQGANPPHGPTPPAGAPGYPPPLAPVPSPSAPAHGQPYGPPASAPVPGAVPQPPFPPGSVPPYGPPAPAGAGYAPPHQPYATGVPGQPAPYAAYAPPPQTPPKGALSWALGFLICVPLPFLSAIAAGVAMAIPHGASKHRPSPARENARTAANWGLTFLLLSTGLLILHFVLLIVLTADGNGSSSFFPIGIPITLYLIVCLAHLVIVIVGTVVASQGKIVRMPLAIPFLRG